jgi:hypothetical protein
MTTTESPFMSLPAAFDALIDPDSFQVDVSLEIACENFDGELQVISRPVAEGYLVDQLLGNDVRFSADDGEIGAIPAVGEGDGGALNATGYAQSVECHLNGKTFSGTSVSLGLYRCSDSLEQAKAALAAPLILLLSAHDEQVEAANRIVELEAALAESKANDRCAMGYLNDVRAIVGGGDFPAMVARVREVFDASPVA